MGHAKQYREIAKHAIDTLNAVGMMMCDSRGPAIIRTASGMNGRLAEVDRERSAARKAPQISADDTALPEVVERIKATDPDFASSWKAQNEQSFKAKKRAEQKRAKAAEKPAEEMTVEVLGTTYKPAPPEHEPELRGQSPRGTKAKQFRLIGIDEAGEPTGFEDVGTATELAERNHIGPSTIYKGANSGKPCGKYLIEKVV